MSANEPTLWSIGYISSNLRVMAQYFDQIVGYDQIRQELGCGELSPSARETIEARRMTLAIDTILEDGMASFWWRASSVSGPPLRSSCPGPRRLHDRHASRRDRLDRQPFPTTVRASEPVPHLDRPAGRFATYHRGDSVREINSGKVINE